MATKVELRQKPISGNRQSLYLDFYPAITDPKTGKNTRREFLNMYLFSEIEFEEQKYFDGNGKEQKRYVEVLDKKGEPKKAKLSAIDKQHNKETEQLAEQIELKRRNQINKPEIYTGYEKEQLKLKEKGEQNFVDYFRALADKRKASNHDNWVSAFKYLDSLTKGKLKFEDLNETFCENFKDYLLTTKSNKSAKAKLNQNSAVSYFNKFKAALKQAYKDGFLKMDLNAKVESINTNETFKQTLTLEELNMLANTQCNNPLLRKAALFSALTGMPFKEMQNLEWGQIEKGTKSLKVKMIRQKSKKPYFVNIGKDAFKLIGEKLSSKDKVFMDLSNKDRYIDFPIWLAKAGIHKKMTFHDLRHTYGCLQIEEGTDLYTIQSNMGHASSRQTAHYAKASDIRKQEASERIKIDGI